MKVNLVNLEIFENLEMDLLQTFHFSVPVPYIHEAIWEAHVQQLIPCSKCGRTFFPDRIKVRQLFRRICSSNMDFF